MKPARPLALPLALLIIHLAVRSTGEAPSPQPVQCAAKLAAMSSCLPYVAVAALPENATLTPSAACCQAFAVAIDGAGGGAGCLCDLVRRPFLHGSWLDASRLVSLLSSCGKSISVEASSFAEICQGPISLSLPARSLSFFFCYDLNSWFFLLDLFLVPVWLTCAFVSSYCSLSELSELLPVSLVRPALSIGLLLCGFLS